MGILSPHSSERSNAFARFARVVAGALELVDALPEVVERVDLVIRHARGERVDERESLVRDPVLDQVRHVLDVAGESPGDVRRPAREGERDRVDRTLDDPVGVDFVFWPIIDVGLAWPVVSP